MSILSSLPIALKVFDKLLDKVPTYDQRMKQKYIKLRKKYEEEDAKDYPQRDDRRVYEYRNDLMRFLDNTADSI